MAKKGRAILLVYADLIDQKYEDEFNAWYDTEHLPELLALPGFLDAARYEALAGGPKYLALYELETPDAIQSPEFTARTRTPWSKRASPSVFGKNFTRIVGQQICPDEIEKPNREMSPAILIGRMSVPASEEDAWNDWYSGELIPEFRKVPGVVMCRRYRGVLGDTPYTTIHEYESEAVRESPGWKQMRDHGSERDRKMMSIIQHGPGSPGLYKRRG